MYVLCIFFFFFYKEKEKQCMWPATFAKFYFIKWVERKRFAPFNIVVKQSLVFFLSLLFL